MLHLQQSRSHDHPTHNNGEQYNSTYNAAANEVFIKEKNCCIQFFLGVGGGEMVEARGTILMKRQAFYLEES